MPRCVAQAGLCSAVLPIDSMAEKNHSLVIGFRSLDYAFLRKILKGLAVALSADKQYLVESRLLPVARRAGLANLGGLVEVIRRWW